LRKVGQVIFGCVVGMLVSLAMSKVWLVKPPKEETQPDEISGPVGKPTPG
jgi:hypothetical protein